MFSIIVWRLIEKKFHLITIIEHVKNDIPNAAAVGGALGDSWGTREAERVRLRCTVKEKLAHDANSEVAAMSLKIPLSCPVSAPPRALRHSLPPHSQPSWATSLVAMIIMNLDFRRLLVHVHRKEGKKRKLSF